MEFWGAEVKPGEPLKVTLDDGIVLHLSQAVLGETKEKSNERVCLSLNIDGKKLVLGQLAAEKIPQVQFDLVFEKDFELTHNWKHGSVYFYGYKADNLLEEDYDVDSDSESDEEVPPTLVNNGKQEAKPMPEKVEKSNAAKKKESGSGKKKVKIVEPNKDLSDEDDDSTDEDFSENSDEDMSEDKDEDDSEDEDDSDASDESDEETPQKKVEVGKKRAAESALKTPIADKKAKVTPQKTDGKKVSSHVATPHPAKQTGKTPASKPSQQTPKSAGTHTCTSCTKGFGSDKALESHTKAKHGGK